MPTYFASKSRGFPRRCIRNCSELEGCKPCVVEDKAGWNDHYDRFDGCPCGNEPLWMSIVDVKNEQSFMDYANKNMTRFGLLISQGNIVRIGVIRKTERGLYRWTTSEVQQEFVLLHDLYCRHIRKLEWIDRL